MGFDLEGVGELGSLRVSEGLGLSGYYEERGIYETLDLIGERKA